MPNNIPSRQSVIRIVPTRSSRWRKRVAQCLSLSPQIREDLRRHTAVCGLFALIGVFLGGVETAIGGATLGAIAAAFTIHRDRKERRREAALEATARGRKLLTAGQARQQTAHLTTASRQDAILWGTIPLPLAAMYCHALVVGAVGSGKTLSLRMLMGQLLPRITGGSDRRAMIYDPKQEMAQLVGSLRNLRCPVRILSPFDRRAVAWDLARDVDSPAGAYQLATALIPAGNDTQPFFKDAARNLLAAVVTYFVKTRPNQWTLREVLLVMRSKQFLRRLLERDESFAAVVENYLDVGEATLASVMSTAATQLGPLESIAALWARSARKFSIKEWLRTESILILGGDPRVRATLDKLNGLIVSLAAQQVLGMSESRQRLSLFLFDEFREAGRLDGGLARLIVSGRSKGASVVLGFQDLDGVAEVYGERVAHELLGQCGLKAFLKLESPKTAEWASKCVGDQEKVERQITNTWSAQGGSSSEAYQRHTRPQIMASEFLDLPVTNPQNGLHGVYLARDVGAYRAAYAWGEMELWLGRIDRTIAGLEPTPAEWQQLCPFSELEKRRLGLNDAADGEATNGAPSPPPYSPLRPLNI